MGQAEELIRTAKKLDKMVSRKNTVRRGENPNHLRTTCCFLRCAFAGSLLLTQTRLLQALRVCAIRRLFVCLFCSGFRVTLGRVCKWFSRRRRGVASWKTRGWREEGKRKWGYTFLSVKGPVRFASGKRASRNATHKEKETMYRQISSSVICQTHFSSQDGFLAQGLPGLHGRFLDGVGVHGAAAVDADALHLLVLFVQPGDVPRHPRRAVGFHFAPEGGVEVLVELGVQEVPRCGFLQILQEHQRFVEVLQEHHQMKTPVDLANVLLDQRAVGIQVVVIAQVEEKEILEVVRVVPFWVVVMPRVPQEFSQLVIAQHLPGQRDDPPKVVERRLKEVGRIPQHRHEDGVRRQQLAHLLVLEAHVVADDVEAHAGLVVFHLVAVEERRVVEIAPSVGEGELEAVLLPETEEDIEEGAAGCFIYSLCHADLQGWDRVGVQKQHEAGEKRPQDEAFTHGLPVLPLGQHYDRLKEEAGENAVWIPVMKILLSLFQTTKIGVAVNAVRKHCSDKEVVALAKLLIKNWKRLLVVLYHGIFKLAITYF
ncbi:PREDICTED: uncharacterized protein LOC106546896 [Thamnophis sirtalis]|uniref:Uncharacterized protein LOC106546896 n=1 Tax=Thamnophis sirtalis TaxID=35019 RepID=A0A6I9XTG2_9SAUR|nr:PREDICTED: uncharacterized protein LOC106546896 [Thamnophis sirtalis]